MKKVQIVLALLLLGACTGEDTRVPLSREAETPSDMNNPTTFNDEGRGFNAGAAVERQGAIFTVQGKQCLTYYDGPGVTSRIPGSRLNVGYFGLGILNDKPGWNFYLFATDKNGSDGKNLCILEQGKGVAGIDFFVLLDGIKHAALSRMILAQNHSCGNSLGQVFACPSTNWIANDGSSHTGLFYESFQHCKLFDSQAYEKVLALGCDPLF